MKTQTKTKVTAKIRADKSLWSRKELLAKEVVIENKKGIFSSFMGIISFSIAQVAAVWGLIFNLAITPNQEQAGLFALVLIVFSILNTICIALLTSYKKGKARSEAELSFTEGVLNIINKGFAFADLDVDVDKKTITAEFESGESIVLNDAIICTNSPVEYAVLNIDNNAAIIP